MTGFRTGYPSNYYSVSGGKNFVLLIILSINAVEYNVLGEEVT